MMDAPLSHDALRVIKELSENYTITSAKEFLEHDGHDEYGPKSNLYDLICMVEGKIAGDRVKIMVYHREDWFDSDIESPFVFDGAYEDVGEMCDYWQNKMKAWMKKIKK